VKNAADLLNWLDKDDGKELLKSIEKRNPTLGGSIRQRMFRFEDLVRLSPGDITKVTKEVDQDDLIIALKNASSELKKAIFATMSKRAVEAIEEQLSFLGPKRLSEVESAQDRVIQIVRELEEDEEIILDTGGSDVVVQ
jgi:flagellar motor switch protein FliG